MSVMRQAEEQQSIYRDPNAPVVHEYDGEDYHNPNPRKRANPDTNENPKKRAAVAVSHRSPQRRYSSTIANTR